MSRRFASFAGSLSVSFIFVLTLLVGLQSHPATARAVTAITPDEVRASQARSPLVCFTPVFINEFHYDNDGADAGEFVEVAGPAGTSLNGWSFACPGLLCYT